MHSRFRTKGVLLAVLLAVVAIAALPGAASAEPQPGVRKKGFRLFANALGALTANRIYCGLAADGRVCVDSTNSSTIGGGFWPKGTPDQYVFNSGLQVAGIVGPEGGPWANDTVGGFFFDPKGTTEHGEQVQPIYNIQNSDDDDNWPAAACVPTDDPTRGGPDFNASLFHPLVQVDSTTGPTGGGSGLPYCRKTASQGDVWFVSWEGNPSLRAGRKHPLGIAVETRGMGWNFPSGNEDILYFIYTFYNVTTTNRQDYINAGIRQSMADILVAKAQDFHAALAAQGVTGVPNTGYTINNLFAAFAADMDVAEAGANYSAVNLPFALGNTYDHAFSQPQDWLFDPSIFGAPFFAGVGFVGVKYLKSPTGAGAIQLFSNTINGQPFAGAVNDPRDVSQLYRYLSGTMSPSFGDQACQYNPVSDRVCFVNNTSPQDMRFFQSSTPLSLAPGQGGSIVVAYIMAAPVPSGNCPSPTCDVKPGDPRLLVNPFTLTSAGANTIDTLTGFRKYSDANGDNIVQQSEFTVVPGSLLGKALTAQAVFDAKFLLPFAPASPDFFLIPGDNQVTVMWKPTDSETSGDPYFSIANAAQVFDPSLGANVSNQLYDPNYRQYDVEGYRVYRGRVDAPNELTLLAQFDYSGTVISDYTGIINPNPDCAPEFGILINCPAAYPAGGNQKNGVTLTAHADYNIGGDLIQVNAGKGRIALADGTAYVVKADTAVIGGAKNGSCGPKSACGALEDQGVPFVYVDRTPRNSFRYFYSVTAYDINSIESGPTSLESPRNTKPVTPVAPASNYENTATLAVHSYGSRPDPNNPGAFIPESQQQDALFPAVPSIDPATGRFSGPFPPADGTTLGFVGEFVKQVVSAPGSLSLQLDSIGGGSAYDNTATTYYLTASAGGSPPVHFAIPVVQDQFDGTHSDVRLFPALNVDDQLAKRYGGDGSYTLQAQIQVNLAGNYYTSAYGRGCVNGAPGYDIGAGCQYNGPRWFDGPSPTKNETKADPNGGNWKNNTSPLSVDRAPVNGVANGGFNNAGELPNVEVIYQPYSYNTMGNQYRDVEGVLGSFKRAADYNVYWSATTAGLIDSVIDVTHNVVVPFDSLRLNASFGLLTAALSPPGPGGAQSFDRRAEVSNTDFGCIQPLRSSPAAQTRITCATAQPYTMTRQASLDPIVFFTISPTDVRTSTNTGTGFAMYIAGNTFLFQTTTLPQNTVWSLRDYVGAVTGGNGWGGSVGPYAYFKQDALTNIPLPFSAVGASISVDFNVVNQINAPIASALKKVHTVPDPYYVTNEFEQSTDNKVIKFVNLPEKAVVRIYTASGVLVNVLEHNSSQFGGELTWNVRNRNNQVVASGVYFYHIEAVQGDSKTRRVGKMTIVNFAQ